MSSSASLALVEATPGRTACVAVRDDTDFDSGRIGQILRGTYRIERLIAQGGMGSVYEATHVRLDHKCALKVLEHQAARNQEAYARFRQEAEIAASLRHPSIVQAFDFNTDEQGNPYMAMELVEGKTLWEHIRGRQLDKDELLALFVPICEALAAAHEAGIVHRDLKPSNVMVREDGEPKLLDFGISKMRDAEDGMTRENVVMGTPNYMAPEQALGRANRVDARTDIFSLGAILYEALAGRRAFEGTGTAPLLHAIIYDRPKPLASLRPDLPERLVKVVQRCLAKNPKKRFQSTAELLEALREATKVVEAQTIPIQVPPRRRASRAWAWALAWLASTAAAAAMTAGFVGSAGPAATPATVAPSVDTAPETVPTIQPESPPTYDDALAGVSARMLSIGVSLYRADARGLTYWSDPGATGLTKPLPSAGEVTALAASRQGEVLVGQSDGTVSRWDRELREPFWHMRFGKQPIVAVASDDHYFAIAIDKNVRLVNARTGRMLRRFGTSGAVVSLLFTRGQRGRLLIVREDALEVVDADGRKSLGSVPLSGRAIRAELLDDSASRPPEIAVDFLQGDWTIRRRFSLHENRNSHAPRLDRISVERI